NGPGNVSLKNGLGSNVSSYPVAVLNLNSAILGVAQNDNQYVNLWNADPVDAAAGQLDISDIATKFNFTPSNPANPVIPQVSAMRFFQFDIAADHLDSMSFPEGSIVDFGDGIKQKFDAVTPLDPSIGFYQIFSGVIQTYIVNGTYNVPGSAFTLNNTVYVMTKTYSNASNKTITVYHNDNDYYLYNDNANGTPGTETSHLLSNLRGHLPIHTKGIHFTSTQQASFNTFANLNLSEFFQNVEFFGMRWGYTSNFFTNYNFGVLTFPNIKAIDFGANRTTNDLVKIIAGTADLVAKYPHLISIGLKQSQYTPDLNLAIANVQQFIMGNYETGNILLPADYDRILIQLASGKTDTGGRIVISGGLSRTAASDAAVSTLLAQGMTVQLN
ncbi:MAG: hypothetical protein H7Z71_07885, partial [Moraxellaceae bacterium]|nr:hypothetical protein [Pseudobdellovibrionaceae bacterium]